MKRTTIHISAALALLLGLAACSRDDAGFLPEGAEGSPMVFTATGLNPAATASPTDAAADAATRATVDGDWQGISSVAVEMNGAVKEYTVTASNADGYRSATLSRAADPFYWTSHNDIRVTAWWPYAETLPVVKVADDQSTLAAFQNSDFIAAEEQAVSYGSPTLRFTHRTARVTVVLKPGTGIASVAGATVSLVSLSAEGSNPTAIKTCNTSGDTYEALAAPQTVAAGKHFIQVVFGGVTFYFRPQNDVVLEAGSRYTYTVKVNATGLTLEGSTIGNWEPGGGESGAAEDTGYIYDNTTNSYTVSNANGLLVWAEAAQNDRTIGCTLTADIDLTGKTWTPIGTESQPYIGTFDGGNHTITGLTIDLPDQAYVGLFGYINGSGTVKDLNLADVSITGNSRVGSVVGWMDFDSKISGCTASGTVSGTRFDTGSITEGYDIGGVVGFSYGEISDCSFSGTVSGYSSVGGVLGRNFGNCPMVNCTASGDISGSYDVGGVVGNAGSRCVLTGCTFSGTVTATGNYVGGVVGTISYSSSIPNSLTDCHASGSVTSEGNYVGGVAGSNSSPMINCTASGSVRGNRWVGGVAGNNSGTLTACYASSTVTGTGDYVGGVAGYNGGALTGCYASGGVSGNSYVGGVVGYNDFGTLIGCYWSNYDGSGIGSGSGETTKVDGTTGHTWVEAQTGMNNAIDAWNGSNPNKQCNWHYAETDAETPPTLEPND